MYFIFVYVAGAIGDPVGAVLRVEGKVNAAWCFLQYRQHEEQGLGIVSCVKEQLLQTGLTDDFQANHFIVVCVGKRRGKLSQMLQK
jgi:hypothetical protein